MGERVMRVVGEILTAVASAIASAVIWLVGGVWQVIVPIIPPLRRRRERERERRSASTPSDDL